MRRLLGCFINHVFVGVFHYDPGRHLNNNKRGPNYDDYFSNYNFIYHILTELSTKIDIFPNDNDNLASVKDTQQNLWQEIIISSPGLYELGKGADT